MYKIVAGCIAVLTIYWPTKKQWLMKNLNIDKTSAETLQESRRLLDQKNNSTLPQVTTTLEKLQGIKSSLSSDHLAQECLTSHIQAHTELLQQSQNDGKN